MQLCTPRERPSHWAPSHCLGCSSQPAPKSPILLRLTIQELGSLDLLVELTATNAGIQGCLPTQLGTMHELRQVRLAGNALSGTVPFYTLGGRESLGKVPALAAPQLGSCTSSGRAWWLWAARYFQGDMTPPLGHWDPGRCLRCSRDPTPKVAESSTFDHICRRELRHLSLSDQSGPGISGTLPLAYTEVAGRSARGQWHASGPAARRLQDHHLHRPTAPPLPPPHSAGAGLGSGGRYFPQLNVVELRGASLSGTLPTQVGDLRGLTVLDLQDARRIQGTIPTEMGRLKSLQYLYLGGTRIGGAPTHIPLQLDFPYMPGKRLFCFPMRLDAESFRKPSTYNPLPTFETWEQQCF